VYPSDEYQGKFAAQYIYKTIGVRKVAILYSNTDWGVHITDVFKREYELLGGNIVFNEGVSQDARDFKTSISKIKESGAELLFAPQYTEGSLVFIKQFINMNLGMKVFGADAWADSKFQKEVGSYGRNEEKHQILYVEVKTGSSEDFANRFLKAYPNQKIGVGVAQGYDAARVLIDAMKISGVEDREMLANTIRKTNFEGVSNHISFDKNGDLVRAEYVVKRILGEGRVEEVR
jgi:branched-chain amino acid transport system substrate-binding protein